MRKLAQQLFDAGKKEALKQEAAFLENDPVAELIVVHIDGTGRSEEFACVNVGVEGYRAPEGVTVKSRQPLYLRRAARDLLLRNGVTGG